MSKFVLGDNVSVLDDIISGTVSKVSGKMITIRTEDGFELEFAPEELVPVSGKTLQDAEVSHHEIAFKEVRPKKKIPRVKPKERHQPAMEVDLHIHQLVPNEKGMSPYDMLTLQLDTAKRRLEFAMDKKIQKVVFIHGVGEGVLRAELEFLFRKYDNIAFYDANYQKYGVGALEVQIFQDKTP